MSNKSRVSSVDGVRKTMFGNISLFRRVMRERRMVISSSSLYLQEYHQFSSLFPSNSFNLFPMKRLYSLTSILFKDKPNHRSNHSISDENLTISRRKKHVDDDNDTSVSAAPGGGGRKKEMDLNELKQVRMERQELKKKNRLEQIEKREKLKKIKDSKNSKGGAGRGGGGRGGKPVESDDDSDFE